MKGNYFGVQKGLLCGNNRKQWQIPLLETESALHVREEKKLSFFFLERDLLVIQLDKDKRLSGFMKDI